MSGMAENRGLGSPVQDDATDATDTTDATYTADASDVTREGAARERSGRLKAAAVRQAQVAAQRRKRQLWIGGAVFVLIAALVTIGVLVQHKQAVANAALGSGPFVAPAAAVGPGSLAIPFGGGSASAASSSSSSSTAAPARVVLTVYEDFRCPYCRLAESMFESTYKSYALAGKIQVQYHLVDLIDRNLGGTGSLRAGNAGACAQDAGPGKFAALHDLLYANQPDENDDAYGSDAALISLAKQVPGLDSPTFEACVNGDVHGSWVKGNYTSLSTVLNGSVATPYYAINGKQYKLTGQPAAAQQAAFRAALDAALAAAR
jgi:protein-disulfide isomerase